MQIIYRPYVIEFKLKYKDQVHDELIEIDKEKVIESLEESNKKIAGILEEKIPKEQDDISKLKCYCNFIYNRELSEEIKDNI